MASFLKSILGINNNKDTFTEKIEDMESIKIEKWNKSDKNIMNIQLLFDILDENYILKEIKNTKSLFNFEKEEEFLHLVKILNLKQNSFSNFQLLDFIKNINEFKNFKELIENKENEINKIIPIKIFAEDKDLKTKPTKNNQQSYQDTLQKFNLQLIKYFFSQENFYHLIFSNRKEKGIIYFDYLRNLIDNVLRENYVKENFKDYYLNAIAQKLNLNNNVEEIITFIFSKIFQTIIEKDNYFNILHELLIDLANTKQDDSSFKKKKNCIFFLIPNVLNYKIIANKQFFNNDININFLFIEKDFESIKKEISLKDDVVNLLLNFLIQFESYIHTNPKIKATNLIENVTYINPTFFQIYNLIFEIIIDNYEDKESKTSTFCFNKDNDINDFIFMDYLISLYRIIKNFNRDFSCNQLLKLENINNFNDNINLTLEENLYNRDQETKENFVEENTSQEKSMSVLNFRNFLINKLDNCINNKVLAKEIFSIKSEDPKNESDFLSYFLKDLFLLIWGKKETVERFKRIKNELEMIELIDSRFIFNERIIKLPSILFIKILEIDSPLKTLINFIQNILNLEKVEKKQKNEFLKFICFVLIEKSLDSLTDDFVRYPVLLERLELVNKFYNIEKIILSVKNKIDFLEVINKNQSKPNALMNDENQYLSLKNLIFEEEKFKSFLHSIIKENSHEDIPKKLILKNFEALKKNKIFSRIYSYISINSNKFASSKGIKFYKNNQKDLFTINFYLHSIDQIILPLEKHAKLYLNIFDFILLFIKNEKLDMFSLEFLNENVINK